MDNVKITETGIEFYPEFKRSDLCWLYRVSKEIRDKHPLGSWSNEDEKRLFKAWHRRRLVMIDKAQTQEFPYPSMYSFYRIKSADYGAWSYSTYLEFLTEGSTEMFNRLSFISKG